VKKVGCSGFAYTYDYADEVRAATGCSRRMTRSSSWTREPAFLDGSTLDFVREGLKQAFKVDNPNVDATCGCGESFSVKEQVTGDSTVPRGTGAPVTSHAFLRF
jgi:iron-sulfur cluster assembly protein